MGDLLSPAILSNYVLNMKNDQKFTIVGGLGLQKSYGISNATD